MNGQTTDYYSKWKNLLQPQALPPKPEQEEEEDYYTKWKAQLAQTQAPPSQDLWQKKSILEKVAPVLQKISPYLKPEGLAKQVVPEMPLERKIKEAKEQIVSGKELAYWKDVASVDWWKKRFTQLYQEAKAFAGEMARRTMVDPRMAMQEMETRRSVMRGVEPEIGDRDLMMQLAEKGQELTGLVTWLPSTFLKIIQDPMKMAEDYPLDTFFALSIVAGKPMHKGSTKIKADWYKLQDTIFAKESINTRKFHQIIDNIPNDVIPPNIKKKLKTEIPPDYNIVITKEKVSASQMPFIGKRPAAKAPARKPVAKLAPEEMPLKFAIKNRKTGEIHLGKEGEIMHADMAIRLMAEGVSIDDMISGFVDKKGNWVTQEVGRKTKGMPPEPVEYITKEGMTKDVEVATRMAEAEPQIKYVSETKKKITNPREQKQWLLNEIDKAIEKAPSVAGEPLAWASPWLERVPIKEGAKKLQVDTIVFEVPGDGIFEVLNTKPNLELFKKRIGKWPVSMLKPELARRGEPSKKALPPEKLQELLAKPEYELEARRAEILAQRAKEKPLTEAEQIAAYEKTGKVEKVPYAPERAKAIAEYEAMAEEAKAVGLETGKPKMPPTKEVKPLTREEISSAKVPEEIMERIRKEGKKAGEVFDELYSGYPFIKEFKESLRRLKKGEAGVLVTKIEKTPLPTRTQTITPKTEKIELQSYSVPTKEPLIVVKQNKAGSMPVFKHEFDPLLKIQDLPPRKVKYYYENPIRIFEEYPSLKRDVYHPIKVAENSYIKELQATQKTIKQYKHETPGGSSKRLGIYSVSKQKGGIDTLKSMRITDVPKLSPAELKAYNEVRANLEKIYVEINQARKLAGYQPMPKVDNYFTFARGLETLKELGINPIFERDVGTLTRHLNAPFFKYGLKRRKVAAPVELDFFTVYENYMNTALKFIHKAPVIAKGRALIGDYSFGVGKTKASWSFQQEYPRLYTYMTQWLDFNAGQKPPSILPQWLNKQLSGLNRNIGMAVLSWNARSALIQPSAFRLAYVEIGARYLAEGIIDNFNPAMRKFAVENSNVLRGRKFDIHVEEMLASQIRKKFGKARVAVAKAGIKPGMQFLDFETARSTWLGGYKRAAKQMKLSHEEARLYADDLVTKTQASAQPSDLAPIQRTPGGRLATIFQTFVINEWNQIQKEVFGLRNPRITNKQRIVKTVRLVWSTALINALFEGVLKIRSPYPAPEWALKYGLEKGEDLQTILGSMLKEMGEQVPLIGGSIRWSTPYRTSWPAPLQVAEGTIKLADKLIARMDIDNISLQDAETIGRLLGIPGTGQTTKYIRRRKQGIPHIKAIIGVRTDVPADKKYAY